MRPRNQLARDRLGTALAPRAAVSAADLAAQVGVSVPTLHRVLQEQADSLVVTGRARRTRYALRRALRGDAAELPLYRVGVAGRTEPLGRLALVCPQGACLSLEGTGWPVPEDSRDGRWGDLPYPLNDMRPQGYLGRQLARAEHLALEAAATRPGVAAARSRIVRHAGRTFLELERFDRHGDFGRSALVSLGTLDAALLGEGSSDWTRLCGRLQAACLLGADVLPRVLRLWWFGRLIANTDMHTGNLSFVPRDGLLGLAPAYDQLPMLYAPLPGGEVPPRSFEPPVPLPAQRAEWLQGCEAAVAFWRRAQVDARISQAFRHECGVNAERLLRVAERV